MTLQKKDFIEIEFTAKVKNTNEIFDSNVKEDLKKANLNLASEPKPLIFSLDEGMFLKGVDDSLIGKPSSPASYEFELAPEKAFGSRNSKLVQIIPTKIFREQKLSPIPGMMFNFDGRVAKVLSVSGGRVIADFNNPIAGKTVVYKIRVLRKISDIREKAKAFIDFLFRRNLNFEIKDKKIIIKTEENMVKFIELFKDKFKEVLDLDLEVAKEKKQEEEKDAAEEK